MTDESQLFAAQVDQIPEGEWNLLLDGFADASLYQTWAYGAVRWGEKQLSHLVLRRGSDPVALAQVRIVRVPVLGVGIAYIRGGPVCTPKGSQCDPVVWQTVVAALIEEYVQRRRLALRFLPPWFRQDGFAEEISAICSRTGCEPAEEANLYHTLRVELRPTLETLRGQLDHKWRNQLNAAERNDLEVTPGTNAGLYAEFTGLYRELMARKRFDTTVSVGEFQRIQERLPESQKMVVLIARKGGRPLSGVVASWIGATGVYLLGATGDEGMKAKGSYLLQWHLLRILKERGCQWYDLGGINIAANPGVYHFKNGMGGEEVTQMGRFQLQRGRMSRLVVGAAERLQAIAVRHGSGRRQGSPSTRA